MRTTSLDSTTLAALGVGTGIRRPFGSAAAVLEIVPMVGPDTLARRHLGHAARLDLPLLAHRSVRAMAAAGNGAPATPWPRRSLQTPDGSAQAAPEGVMDPDVTAPAGYEVAGILPAKEPPAWLDGDPNG